MKPKILISLGSDMAVNYSNAVEAAGGQAHALYLPDIEYTDEADALILSGGADIDPAFYGQENRHCFAADTERDRCELKLIDSFIKAGKPVLGICRGHQILNVFFSGSLVQDLPTASTHTWNADGRAKPGEPMYLGDMSHESTIKPGSFLEPIYGLNPVVNSAHHQGADRVSTELEAVQWACDGVIEAFAHRSLPVYSVQWHPERMCGEMRRAGMADGSLLFDWFINEVCCHAAV